MKPDKVNQTIETIRDSKIEKALGPEGKAILGDIRALLDKIDQLEAAEGQPGAESAPEAEDKPNLLEMAMKAADAMGIGADGEPDKPKDEEDKAAKATASDSADQRLGDNPEADAAIKLIGKALLGMMKPEARVAKSMRSEVDQGVVAVLGKLSAQLDTNTRAIEGILQGIGATEIIEKSATHEPKQPYQQSPNAAAQLLDIILKAAGVQPGARVEKGNGFDDYVPEEEGLGTVLKALGKAGVVGASEAPDIG